MASGENCRAKEIIMVRCTAVEVRRVVPNASWVVQNPEAAVDGRMESQAYWIVSVKSPHIAHAIMVNS